MPDIESHGGQTARARADHGHAAHPRLRPSGLQTRHCDLEVGRLSVSWEGGCAEAALPFGFAERNNPRRAFLFVSRVLGRHVPVSPARMRQAFTALADDIPADLPGPIVMTGMAETAIGLGAGVHDAFLRRTGRDDVLFLSTTRAPFDAPVLTAFSEQHSHASAHRVYRPQHSADRLLLHKAQSLVMVDDEASSGDTFSNLHTALAAAGLGRMEHVHTAVLTDWRGSRPVRRTASATAGTWTRSALLFGQFEWVPAASAPRRTLPDADRMRETRVRPLRRQDDGRLGRSCRSSTGCPAPLLAALQEVRGTIIVLGTGEHVWEPFLVAEALEHEGHDVRFGATTRSPILPGHAIRRGLAFADHEGLGITNYLYNVDPAAQIVLCVDTSLAALDARLLAALRPHVLVGNVFHPWATLTGRLQGVAPATGFDIGPAPTGA